MYRRHARSGLMATRCNTKVWHPSRLWRSVEILLENCGAFRTLELSQEVREWPRHDTAMRYCPPHRTRSARWWETTPAVSTPPGYHPRPPSLSAPSVHTGRVGNMLLLNLYTCMDIYGDTERIIYTLPTIVCSATTTPCLLAGRSSLTAHSLRKQKPASACQHDSGAAECSWQQHGSTQLSGPAGLPW